MALRVAVSLAAVLGLLWFLSRRFASSPARRRSADAITVVAKQGVGAKAQVVIIQTEETRYVLGVTEHGVSVLDRLPSPVISTASGRGVRDEPAQDDRFALALAASAGDPYAGELATPDADGDAPQLRVRHRAPSPLQGSILSPATWRQTAEALRRQR